MQNNHFSKFYPSKGNMVIAQPSHFDDPAPSPLPNPMPKRSTSPNPTHLARCKVALSRCSSCRHCPALFLALAAAALARHHDGRPTLSIERRVGRPTLTLAHRGGRLALVPAAKCCRPALGPATAVRPLGRRSCRR